MSALDDVVERGSKKHKAEERKMFRELRRAYRDIERDLMVEVTNVTAEIEKNPNKIYEQRRINSLVSQVRVEMQKYGDDYVKPITARGMVQSSYIGSQEADNALRSVMGDVATGVVLPVPTINAFMTQLSTGPLGKLFDSFGDEAAAKARATMLRSITLGHNPRKTARELRKSLMTSRNRSLLIARTETLRAHREGARQTYKANGIQKWVWHAAASARTCAACWALHGREFDIDEKMGAHPACRCSMVPKTPSWKERGFNVEGDSVIEDGETLFAQQPASVQQSVLGSTQYKRYKSGEITLNDFVAVKNSAYGKTYTKKVPR